MSQSYSPSDPFDQPQAPSKGMAITSLVLGILGCVPLVGIVGIVLGIVALRRAKSEPTRFTGEGLAIGGIVAGSITTLCLCIGGGLAGVMFPAIAASRQAFGHVMVTENMRQVGLAITTYAADNHDAMPQGDLKAALVPTYVNSFVFAPSDREQAGDAFTYVGGFQKISDIKSPSQTILAYENNPHPLQGRIAVLYADGSVHEVQAADLTTMLANNGQAGAAPPSGRPPRRRSGGGN